jgi:hypothetical protein
MIRNGLYLAETSFLTGGRLQHIMVLRDGAMRGGGGFYYTVGSYTCSGGALKDRFASRAPFLPRLFTSGVMGGSYPDLGRLAQDDAHRVEQVHRNG